MVVHQFKNSNLMIFFTHVVLIWIFVTDKHLCVQPLSWVLDQPRGVWSLQVRWWRASQEVLNKDKPLIEVSVNENTPNVFRPHATTVILDCVWGKRGQENHLIIVTSSFSKKLRFQQPRSQGPLSSYLEKVPWLRLVTCLLDFCRFQRCDSREGLES